MEKSNRRSTSEVDPAGEIDFSENLDIVHFHSRLEVVVFLHVGCKMGP